MPCLSRCEQRIARDPKVILTIYVLDCRKAFNVVAPLQGNEARLILRPGRNGPVDVYLVQDASGGEHQCIAGFRSSDCEGRILREDCGGEYEEERSSEYLQHPADSLWNGTSAVLGYGICRF